MPTLDVTEVLFCAEFADTFDVIRCAEFVDDDGIGRSSSAPVAGVSGVVQNTSELSLQRLAEGAMLASTIEIWTTYNLTSGVGGQGADQVVFQGGTYTVTDVADWLRYGAGFCRAVCKLNELEPIAV